MQELYENRRLREKHREKAYPRGERTLLKGMSMSCRPLARLRPPCFLVIDAQAVCGHDLNSYPKSRPGGAR